MPVNALLLSVLVSLAVPGRSDLIKPVFFIENQPWQNTTHAGYLGHFKIPITVESPKWWIALIYDQPVTEFEVWQARLMKTSEDKHIVYIKETVYNGHQYPGMVMDQRYLVGYEKKADVDYSEYTGPRPTIVFRDHVYIPDPTKTLEHEMTVLKTTDYDFPANFEMLPVLTVTTAAPSTVASLTKGPNAGPFWWVFTDQPGDERRGSIPLTRATTVPTTAPTTTETPPMPCHEKVEQWRSRCKKRGTDTKGCFLPQCSTFNKKRYSIIQCWKYMGNCWCANSRTGKRLKNKPATRYKNRHMMTYCLQRGNAATIATTTTVGPTLATLAPGSRPSGRPAFIPRRSYNYNLLIDNSLLFFEAQRSGNISENGRISWRRSAHERDGSDCGGVDLAGGYYVSGDYVKYSFPTTSALTMLAWGFLEFKDAYENAFQTRFLKEALKWGTDYIMKGHVSKYKLVAQVGDAKNENSFWRAPQDMTVPRPCYYISNKNPGSDLAGESAAALAATAKVWMASGSPRNDRYVQKLLGHARELYDFAKKFQGIYSFSVRASLDYYPSSSYEDELAWAAVWLYEATGEARYLAEAGAFNDKFSLSLSRDEVSWDNKAVPVQILLARSAAANGAAAASRTYTKSVINFCTFQSPGGGATYTPQGLLFANSWGTTRYASNAAFICLVASKLPALSDAQKLNYRKFAEDQLDYMLGKTGKSFVVGYGFNYPTQPHHRASSCSLAGTCGWDSYHSTKRNPHLLTGALVGGPDELDVWSNDRKDFKSNGVSLDYNSGLQGAAAGLRHFQLEYNTWLVGRSRGRQ